MSRPKKARSHRRRPRTPSELLLTGSLVCLLIGTLLQFGGVTNTARLFGHGMLALALLAAASMREDLLRGRGTPLRLAGTLGLFAVAALPGLLPIPSFLRGLIAPGWADLRGSSHLASSFEPATTLSSLTMVPLAAGTAFAVATWAGRSRARRYGWLFMTVAFTAMMALAAGWALRGSRSWLGEGIAGPFFVPFVNTNHFGSMVVVVYPFFAGRALSRRPGDLPNWVAALLAAAALGLAAWAGSTAPLVIMLLSTVVLLRLERQLPYGLLVGAIGAGGGLLVAYDRAFSHGGMLSLHGRIPAWLSTARLALDHWLFGTGLGTFQVAFPSYRTDHATETWNHAHNDLLEWVAETGLFGVGVLVVITVLLFPRGRRRGAGSRYALLGLASFGLDALIDFPFRLPGLVLLVVALLAWRAVVYERNPQAPILLYRGVALLLVGTQLISMAWLYRDRVVEQATEQLLAMPRGSSAHSGALTTLQRWAPGAAEVGIERAIQLAQLGRVDEAEAVAVAVSDAHRYRAPIQVTLGRVFAEMGRTELAVQHVDRAVFLGPSEWRFWKMRAQTYERVGHPDTVDAWRDALFAGAPHALNDCWRVLPVGVYWLTMMEDRSTRELITLARFLDDKGKRGLALVAYDEVHRRSPSTFSVEHARLLVADDAARAIPYLERAVRAQPRHREFRRLLARTLESAGRWEEAARTWEKLAKHDGEARFRAARATFEANGAAEALLMLERARARGERLHPDSYLLKAQLHAALGNRSQCVATIVGSRLLDKQSTRAKAQAGLKACEGR